MVKNLFYLFLLLSSIQTFGQYNISGKIYNEDRSILKNTEVKIDGKLLNKSTVTDETGNFSFSNIPSGKYIITITKDRFRQQKNVKIDNKDVETDFVLSKNDTRTNDIEAVELNGIKSVKSELEKKGFAVNVIEMKDIATRNLQTVEVLDRSVGVRIRQNGGLGSDIALNINGMTGNSIRILIDGIPSTAYGASFNLNSIPPAMIERIEVYKGVLPGSVADDALGGAINIILKKEARNNLGLSVSYGSFNTMQLDFNTSYRATNGLTTNLSGFYTHSDNDYKVYGRGVFNVQPNGQVVPAKERRFNDAFDSRGILAEVGFTKVQWADQLMLGYTRSESYKEVQHGLFMSTPYGGRFTESNADIVTLRYSKKNFLLKNLDLNVNALYSERDRKVNDTVKWLYNWNGEIATGFNGNLLTTQSGAQQGAPTLMNNHLTTYSTRAAATYHINANNRFVATYFYQNIDRDDDDPIRTILERAFMGTRDMNKTNASFSYELNAFKNKLKFSAFGKYYEQTSRRVDTVVQLINGQQQRVEIEENRTVSTEGYGFATSYLVTPAIMIMASAEKVVRLPDEGEVFGNPGENITQNFNLNPETSENLNLGFKIGPYKIAEKHQISLATNGFLRDTKDKIIRFEVSNNVNEAQQTLPFVNYSATKSTGVDAELMYSFLKRLFVTYNVSRFKTVFNRADDSYKGLQIPNEPTFTMNATLQYAFDNIFSQGSKLNIFYNYRHVGEFNSFIARTANIAGVDYFKVPEQNIHDLGFSYQFPRNIIVSFDAKNIFNKQAYDNFAVQRPGRAFYLKLNFNINNIYN